MASSSSSGSRGFNGIRAVFNVNVIPPRTTKSGENVRTIVLTHGFGTDQSVWRSVIPYLDPDVRVILFDFAGSGSVNPDIFIDNLPKYSTLTGFVQDVFDILDSCEVRECIYVGHAISASIGILATVKRPGLFSKLILIGASPRLLDDEYYHGGFTSEDIATILQAMEENYELWARRFAPTAVGGNAGASGVASDLPCALQEYSRTLFNIRPDVATHVSNLGFNMDLRDILWPVKTPTHLIYTGSHVTAPKSVIGFMRINLGGRTRVTRLNSEGHLPQLSHPELLGRAKLDAMDWWELLNFAELKRSSISFFDIEKPETTVSRWLRATTRTAIVGKGLSKDEKARKLAFQHWLEAIDPWHRYGHNLQFYYAKWLHCESKQPFFYWLDIGDGKEFSSERCPRSKLHQQCIKYLGSIERQAYEVIVEKGKTLVYKQSQKPLDTRGGAKWIFVISTSKTLYVGQKCKGKFQHSSFLTGGATLSAGRLVVHDGILKAVWPHSGHYRPTEENFQEFMSYLMEHNVDLAYVKKCPIEEEVPCP